MLLLHVDLAFHAASEELSVIDSPVLVGVEDVHQLFHLPLLEISTNRLQRFGKLVLCDEAVPVQVNCNECSP